MAIEIIVPNLGEIGEPVTIAHWYKQPGDRVRAGEPLFDAETAKATLTIEAAESGRLEKIIVAEGVQVPIGTVVAWLVREGESETQGPQAIGDTVPQPVGAPREPIQGRAAAEGVNPPNAPAGPRDRPYASPKVRRMAQERGISLEGIVGSGPGGLIVVEDLDSAPVRASETLREVVARRMAEAKATIPHFYLLAEVDMSGIEGLRASCASLPGWKSPPTYSVLLVRAIGLTLARLPSHNLVMHEGRPARHPSTDVGLAVATPAGLIAPVMRDVASKPLLQVAARVQALVEGARAGRLNASDLGPHAVTLSNLGMQGVDAFIGIIDPPGTMLLAVGRVTDRVVARDGQVAIRPMLTLAGSFDHRAFDGALAAAFVDQLRQLLENPSELMGEGALS